MNEWCIMKSNGGTVYSRTHKYVQYFTFFLQRELYYCAKCGDKLHPEEYEEYTRYITAINKVKE